AVPVDDVEHVFRAFADSHDLGSVDFYAEVDEDLPHLAQQPRPVTGDDFHDGAAVRDVIVELDGGAGREHAHLPRGAAGDLDDAVVGSRQNMRQRLPYFPQALVVYLDAPVEFHKYKGVQAQPV